ncbi:LuxR C-terminal-related transcriptional regulator [Pirellulaceae bacterium SH449]
MSFRILCADECETIRRGIQAITNLNQCPVDRFVTSVMELESALQSEHYDILITDIRLGAINMIEYVGTLKEQLPDLKAILYTAVPNACLVAQALSHQFHDAVFKTGSAEKLIRSIHSVGTGQLPSGSPMLIVKSFLDGMDADLTTLPAQITKREAQVLLHLSLGLSNREISSAIGISVETVKEHVQNLLRKLSLTDRTAAAVWALKTGIRQIEMPVG